VNKKNIVVMATLLLGFLLTTANVFANPAIVAKPPHTPGAKATEKAEEQHASSSHNGQSTGNGSQVTPGAKATEQAIKRATKVKDKPKGQRVTYRGNVSAVGDSSLTLDLDAGGSMTFDVTQDTRIHIPTLGREAGLADLHTGVQALVQVLKNEASGPAMFVKVIPGKPGPVHRVGIVTAYTPGTSITVQDKQGGSSTFLITPDTKILPAHRAGQLGVGSHATVISRRDVTAGPLTAQGIVVHPQLATALPPAESATATATATP
jgi:hypothetical protein